MFCQMHVSSLSPLYSLWAPCFVRAPCLWAPCFVRCMFPLSLSCPQFLIFLKLSLPSQWLEGRWGSVSEPLPTMTSALLLTLMETPTPRRRTSKLTTDNLPIPIYDFQDYEHVCVCVARQTAIHTSNRAEIWLLEHCYIWHNVLIFTHAWCDSTDEC